MKQIPSAQQQSGASLIEILVAVLILSIGLLAMAAMMSYATLLPKSSANRSIAISTASNMIERMRANPSASPTFSITSYATSTFSVTPGATALPGGSTCAYPACTPTSMATMDLAVVQQQLNQQLPPAGMTIQITDAVNNEGNLWIIWQEPASFSSFSTANSDNCPAAIVAMNLDPAPRCIYMPFKL
jgi:type IV pilus assembly protein PilV